MVRTYERTTTRGADGGRYSRPELKAAVEDVKEGKKTIRGAAKSYNIPRTTLKHYLTGTRGGGVVSCAGKGGGGKFCLSEEHEQRLVECIKTMEKWGFGLSRQEVLDVVQAYTQSNHLKTKFKDGRPGEDWFIYFAKRYRLSIKKPQAVEYLRMSQVNPYVIYGFFDLLTKTVDDRELRQNPRQIFNLDETSFCHDPKKTKVVGAVGVRSTRMISSAGRENTSVLICTSAAGQKLPPLVIFKGKNIVESWISQNVHHETAYAASKRGWMQSDIFFNWFKKCFLVNIPQERPILLLYDGHSTHVSPELCKIALENEVTIVKLPPHTTHVLQPLDVTIFGPFKTDWDKKLVKWQRQNPRKRIPKSEFVELLNSVYKDISIDNIKKGFKTTGIYDESRAEIGLHPVNSEAIKQTIFRPDELRRYQFTKGQNDKTSPTNVDLEQMIERHVTADHELNDPDALTTEEVPNANNLHDSPDLSVRNISLVKNATDVQDEDTGGDPTESVEDPESMEISDIVENRSIDDGPRSSTSSEYHKIMNKKAPDQESIPQGKSFEQILLELVQNNKKAPEIPQKRRRICTGTEIITTKEYIERLEKEKENKIKSNTKRDKKVKKIPAAPVQPTSVLKQRKSRRAVSPISSLSSEESYNSDEIVESDEEYATLVEVVTGDYVIVNFNGIFYPGQVTAIDLKNIVRVKHMTKCSKINAWRWPDKHDFVDYDLADILKIITPPKEKNNRNMYSVPEMDKFIK